MSTGTQELSGQKPGPTCTAHSKPSESRSIECCTGFCLSLSPFPAPQIPLLLLGKQYYLQISTHGVVSRLPSYSCSWWPCCVTCMSRCKDLLSTWCLPYAEVGLLDSSTPPGHVWTSCVQRGQIQQTQCSRMWKVVVAMVGAQGFSAWCFFNLTYIQNLKLPNSGNPLLAVGGSGDNIAGFYTANTSLCSVNGQVL